LKVNLLLLVSAMLTLACGSNGTRSPQQASPIVNPSGNCQASGDGSRAGYHSAAGSTWLPDCENPLRREYWRVFAQTKDSAYVIPRPDGAPELAPACNAPDHELGQIVQRQALCHSAESSEQVERVNDIPPADALALTRFLHGKLRFTAGGGIGVTPHPLPTDILDACALHPAAASADLRSICDRERERLESGHDIGFSYVGPGAIELAALLNELYGVR
jgi:hypothetical protein